MKHVSAATAIFCMLLLRCFDATRGPPLGSRSRTAIVPHIFTGCPDATCASCSWDHEDQATQTYCTACWPGFTLVDGNCVEREQGAWASGPTLEFLKPVVQAASEVSAKVHQEVDAVFKAPSFLSLKATTTRNITNQSASAGDSAKNSTAATKSNRTSSRISEKRVKLDINQKVYIEGQLTIGNGEKGSFGKNKCNQFASYMVDSPSKPTVKVCGTQIKMEVFLFGECNAGYPGYGDRVWTIGVCNTKKPASWCETFSPQNDSSFGATQTWRASYC